MSRNIMVFGIILAATLSGCSLGDGTSIRGEFGDVPLEEVGTALFATSLEDGSTYIVISDSVLSCADLAALKPVCISGSNTVTTLHLGMGDEQGGWQPGLAEETYTVINPLDGEPPQAGQRVVEGVTVSEDLAEGLIVRFYTTGGEFTLRDVEEDHTLAGSLDLEWEDGSGLGLVGKTAGKFELEFCPGGVTNTVMELSAKCG